MWLAKYFTHERFGFQCTTLSACLTTEQYRLKWTVLAT
jgi:hypothetical protein